MQLRHRLRSVNIPQDVRDELVRRERTIYREQSSHTKFMVIHRRRGTESYESALTAACKRAGIRKGVARVFLTCLIDEMAQRLVRGEFILIPRLGIFAVLPKYAQRKFRLQFSPDTAMRLRIHEELSGALNNVEKFYHIVRGFSTSVPPFLRRGATFAGLIQRDLASGHREMQQERIEELRAHGKGK